MIRKYDTGKILELLDAIDAWSKADSDVADNGWNSENEWLWDDAKYRMLALSDEIRADLKAEVNGEVVPDEETEEVP